MGSGREKGAHWAGKLSPPVVGDQLFSLNHPVDDRNFWAKYSDFVHQHGAHDELTDHVEQKGDTLYTREKADNITRSTIEPEYNYTYRKTQKNYNPDRATMDEFNTNLNLTPSDGLAGKNSRYTNKIQSNIVKAADQIKDLEQEKQFFVNAKGKISELKDQKLTAQDTLIQNIPAIMTRNDRGDYFGNDLAPRPNDYVEPLSSGATRGSYTVARNGHDEAYIFNIRSKGGALSPERVGEFRTLMEKATTNALTTLHEGEHHWANLEFWSHENTFRTNFANRIRGAVILHSQKAAIDHWNQTHGKNEQIELRVSRWFVVPPKGK